MNPPAEDTIRDGLALVACAVYGDAEGAMAVLRNADCQFVAAFLAAVCRDLLHDIAWLSDAPSGDVLAALRAHHGV